MKLEPKSRLSQMVLELRQAKLSQVLILTGPRTERLQLANAIATQLGRAIHIESVSQVERPRLLNAATSILFFDEADSLFGKRTDVKDAHDRYANLQASFAGLILLGVDAVSNLPHAVVQSSRLLVVDQYWPPR